MKEENKRKKKVYNYDIYVYRNSLLIKSVECYLLRNSLNCVIKLNSTLSMHKVFK